MDLLLTLAAAGHGAAATADGSFQDLVSKTFNEPKTWVLVGLLAFLGLVWRFGGFKAITFALDDRAQRIAKELAEAERLRKEAEALVATYAAKAAAAESEARVIVAQARADAEALRNAARRELDLDLARRERITEERIARAERQVAAEAQRVAIEAAVAAAEVVLRREVTPAVQAGLVAHGVEDVRRRFS